MQYSIANLQMRIKATINWVATYLKSSYGESSLTRLSPLVRGSLIASSGRFNEWAAVGSGEAAHTDKVASFIQGTIAEAAPVPPLMLLVTSGVLDVLAFGCRWKLKRLQRYHQNYYKHLSPSQIRWNKSCKMEFVIQSYKRLRDAPSISNVSAE